MLYQTNVALRINLTIWELLIVHLILRQIILRLDGQLDALILKLNQSYNGSPISYTMNQDAD